MSGSCVKSGRITSGWMPMTGCAGAESSGAKFNHGRPVTRPPRRPAARFPSTCNSLKSFCATQPGCIRRGRPIAGACHARCIITAAGILAPPKLAVDWLDEARGRLHGLHTVRPRHHRRLPRRRSARALDDRRNAARLWQGVLVLPPRRWWQRCTGARRRWLAVDWQVSSDHKKLVDAIIAGVSPGQVKDRMTALPPA